MLILTKAHQNHNQVKYNDLNPPLYSLPSENLVSLKRCTIARLLANYVLKSSCFSLQSVFLQNLFLVFTSAVKDLCYQIKIISILFWSIIEQICRPQTVIQLLAGFQASIWHIFRSHVLNSRLQLCDEMLPLWFNFWRCHCAYSDVQKMIL